VRLISRDANDLSRADLRSQVSDRGANNLFSLVRVRTAFPDEHPQQLNYRPVPHDCLLHFDGRSVYYSLNQLVIRTGIARAAGPFDTHVGSVADFDWLIRLTSGVGTVHVPKKIAMWRLHGDQLSLKRDEARENVRRVAAQRTLKKIEERFPLSSAERAAVLLPLNITAGKSPLSRVLGWFQSLLLVARLFLRHPVATSRALLRTKFRFGTRRHTLLPVIFERLALKAEALTTEN